MVVSSTVDKSQLDSDQRKHKILHTNRYHAFAVAIQILQHHLAQSVDLAAALVPALARAPSSTSLATHLVIALVLGQPALLDLEVAQDAGDLAHDALVRLDQAVPAPLRRPVSLAAVVDDDAKIEDELVALVALVVDDAHRVREDQVRRRRRAQRQQPVAQRLRRDQVRREQGEVEQRLVRVCACGAIGACGCRRIAGACALGE